MSFRVAVFARDGRGGGGGVMVAMVVLVLVLLEADGSTRSAAKGSESTIGADTGVFRFGGGFCRELRVLSVRVFSVGDRGLKADGGVGAARAGAETKGSW